MFGRADFSRHESQPTMTIAAGLSLGSPMPRAAMPDASNRFSVLPVHREPTEARP